MQDAGQLTLIESQTAPPEASVPPVLSRPGDSNDQTANLQDQLSISFFCSNCASKIQVMGSQRGKFVICGKCRMQTFVPNIVVAELSSEMQVDETDSSSTSSEPESTTPSRTIRNYRRRNARRSKRFSPILRVGVGLLVVLLVTVVIWLIVRQNRKLSDEEVHQRTVASSSLILVKTNLGEAGNGSGCLIDRDRKLLVTAYHVAGNASKIKVIFPKYRDGRLLTSPDDYGLSDAVDATVWKSDSRRDLAILRLERVPKEAQVLSLAASSPKPGEEVHTVGGHPAGSIGLWVYSKGNVREVQEDKFMLNSGQHVHAWIIRTTNPVNAGDSGGALVNKNCELVGICCGGHRGADLVNAFIDVREIRALLEK